MPNLNDLSIYPQLDPSGMWSRIANFPGQVKQAWEEPAHWNLPESYAQVNKVVLVGMGGSAVGGDLIADLLAFETKGCVFVVCRDYYLPGWVDQDTLVVLCSYSGNTLETLACFHQALDRSAKVVVITSGGILGNEAVSRNVPYLKIRYQGEPRTALGFSFLSPLGLLQQLGLIADKNEEIIECVTLLEDSAAYYLPECPSDNNPAKALAGLLSERMAVIYSGGFLGGVARRWKTQINENAKTWAFVETLPELNHNAIAGYQFPQAVAKNSFVVLLRSSLLQEEVVSLYPMTLAILERAGIDYQVVDAPGKTPLSQMLATIFRGDWVSYYLALINGVDPSPVTAIDEIKSRLGGQ